MDVNIQICKNKFCMKKKDFILAIMWKINYMQVKI